MKTLSSEEFAQRLLHSDFADGNIHKMRVGDGNTVSVNISALNRQERNLAVGAMAEISAMTGLRFNQVTGSARITYSHNGVGANTSVTGGRNSIDHAEVRIASSRVHEGDGYGSYVFRTYMHETMHALGLGHPQDYGRVTDFSRSDIANDSWQMSLMSYFDQDENTRIHATKAYNLTPMVADYLAITSLYGAAAIHSGATVYGVGSTAGGSLDHAARLGGMATFLIADSSGEDRIDFSETKAAQRIDLAPGAISDVMGGIGNMQIAPDTVIENAVGGRGNDTLIGNGVANRLMGGDGNDALSGDRAADTLDGGNGDDDLGGGTSNDSLIGGEGNDSLRGDGGDDRLSDAAGRNLLDGGDGRDTLIGGSDSDRMFGGAGDDSLKGNAGNDALEGGAGNDRLIAGIGNDILKGGEGNDLLAGEAGNDQLFGGAGNDELLASAGTDVLDGGSGNDLLRGGIGRDRFVFADGDDTIRGFSLREDIIDLRGIAGLDDWTDVRAHLSAVGHNVEFHSGNDTLLIEAVSLSDLSAQHFIW